MHPIVLDIRNILIDLNLRSIQTIIHSVKSHINIEPNEQVDGFTKWSGLEGILDKLVLCMEEILSITKDLIVLRN